MPSPCWRGAHGRHHRIHRRHRARLRPRAGRRGVRPRARRPGRGTTAAGCRRADRRRTASPARCSAPTSADLDDTRRVEERLLRGPLDLLVNNAGFGMRATLRRGRHRGRAAQPRRPGSRGDAAEPRRAHPPARPGLRRHRQRVEHCRVHAARDVRRQQGLGDQLQRMGERPLPRPGGAGDGAVPGLRAHGVPPADGGRR